MSSGVAGQVIEALQKDERAWHHGRKYRVLTHRKQTVPRASSPLTCFADAVRLAEANCAIHQSRTQVVLENPNEALVSFVPGEYGVPKLVQVAETAVL